MSKLRKLETKFLYRECPGGQAKVEWNAGPVLCWMGMCNAVQSAPGPPNDKQKTNKQNLSTDEQNGPHGQHYRHWEPPV